MVSVIVPARGGSKSIPGKNVRPINGIPLIGRTVAAAARARCVETVYVSTDDAEIARIARSYGAEIIDRPAAIATDEASSESALLHALGVMERERGDMPDVVVFLQCTSPFTTSEHIDGMVTLMERERADSALMAQPTHVFLWQQQPDGSVTGVNHDLRTRPRRQDRVPEFVETGAGYAFRRAGFLAAKHRFFGRVVLYDTSGIPAVELDEPGDFIVAEELIKRFDRDRERPRLPDRIGLLVFDFDGVMTDDRVFVGDDGRETVACSRSDGMGVELLREAGVPMLVISKEVNTVVKARCDKLQIPCFQGRDDKLTCLTGYCGERGIDLRDVIYVGNDVNDLPCMEAVGFGVAPQDARKAALNAADLVLSAPGGRGAVRELAEIILASRPSGAETASSRGHAAGA